MNKQKPSIQVVALVFNALVLFAHRAASQGCRRDECVLLTDCPQLHGLLRNPTRQNIRELQNATCFISKREPWVCCPAPVTEPPPVIKESLLPKDCGRTSENKVVGGEDAPIDAYPWAAVLGYRSKSSSNILFECGGSVINERYIMTAAHCVNADILIPRQIELALVRLGEWDLSTEIDFTINNGKEFHAPPVQDFDIEEVIEHPAYNNRTLFSDDIALIRLSKPINFFTSAGFILPVCLPAADFSLSEEARARGAIVAGWGVTEKGAKSDRLQHLVLPFAGKEECNVKYKNTLVDEQLCMGGEPGKDSCRGDSGGPLILKTGSERQISTQIGIVSYGPTQCGLVGFPGVYTFVQSYRSWIEENLKP
ncbi:CLIP domain-containing serine protease 14D-like isoform X2 [Penaeus japonicus]|uniref:CLIP domain-containing serine protease 14D-like isoform X2 n=1 Tax=Penaeus japonicus TaxID=27405 RepID=UPI001C70F51E|nr:CLIP domain-containing serine protease 14D-like isoform X2 [Penaeus japonicus]